MYIRITLRLMLLRPGVLMSFFKVFTIDLHVTSFATVITRKAEEFKKCNNIVSLNLFLIPMITTFRFQCAD